MDNADGTQTALWAMGEDKQLASVRVSSEQDQKGNT